MLRVSKRVPKPRVQPVVIAKSEPSEAEDSLYEFFVNLFQEEQVAAQEDALNADSIDSDIVQTILNAMTEVDHAKAVAELLGILERSALKAAVPAFERFLRAHPVSAPASATGVSSEIQVTAGLLEMQFDIVDNNVRQWASAYAGQLVVQIDDQMRNAVRLNTVDATAGRLTAQQMARNIARIIPLHDRYQNAVNRSWSMTYRNALKDGVNPDVALERANRIADNYAARLTRLRARTIARTEIMLASNNGAYLGQMTAISSGMVNANVLKEWETAEDEDVCPICGPLDHRKVAFTEPWADPHTGALVGIIPPAHPNCRCTYSLVALDDPFELMDSTPKQVIPGA